MKKYLILFFSLTVLFSCSSIEQEDYHFSLKEINLDYHYIDYQTRDSIINKIPENVIFMIELYNNSDNIQSFNFVSKKNRDSKLNQVIMLYEGAEINLYTIKEKISIEPHQKTMFATEINYEDYNKLQAFLSFFLDEDNEEKLTQIELLVKDINGSTFPISDTNGYNVFVLYADTSLNYLTDKK